MVPQQAYYASAATHAPPVYGNPPFPLSGFGQQLESLPVQVGIPAVAAGAAVYGPGAQQAPYMGNAAMGPPSYPINNNQISFVQGTGSDNAFVAPPNGNMPGQWQGQAIPPCASSYPPGFEPRHNNVAIGGLSEPWHNNVAMGGLSEPWHNNVAMGGPSMSHPHPCPHPHPQPLSSCHGVPQQEQQCHYTPMTFPTAPNACLPNFQVFDANGTAIGVPVMGLPTYMDASFAGPPPTMFHGQQSIQPRHRENSVSTEAAPQSCKSTFAFTKYFRGNHLHLLTPHKPERQFCSNGWQPPNTQRIDQPRSGPTTDHSRSSSHPYSAIGRNRAHSLPPPRPETQQLCAEEWKPSNVKRIDKPQSVPVDEHLRSDTGYPCSVMEGNQPHSLSPLKAQMWPCANGNGRQPPNTYRVDQRQSNGHLKFCTGHPSSAMEENGSNGLGNTPDMHVNGHKESQSYKSSEYRGNLHTKGMGARADQQLWCDPCELTFTSSEYFDTHLSSHIKCGEEECTFEASGKIVEEHKVVEHGKASAPTTFIGHRDLSFQPMENKGGITLWREERKNRYPTSANILRKAEEKKKREVKGEFSDEESQKRQQHMRDVLARQKELGFEAAEIPADFFSIRHTKPQRPSRVDRNIELKEWGMVETATAITNSRAGEDDSQRKNLAANKRTCSTADGSEMSHEIADMEPITVPPLQEEPLWKVSELENDIQDMELQHTSFIGEISTQNHADKMPNIHGHNRKGFGSEFLPRRKRRKQLSDLDNIDAQQPMLLSKLLDYDIQKENSHLLQCCRFIVNNSFLQQLSTAALKHLEWIEVGKSFSVDGLSADGMHATTLSNSATAKEMHALSDSEDAAAGKEMHILSDSQDSVIEKERERVFKREETIWEQSKPTLANIKDSFHADGLIQDAAHAPVLLLREFTHKKGEQDPILEEQFSRNGSQHCHENNVLEVDSKSKSTSQSQSTVDRLGSGAQPSVLSEAYNSQNQSIEDRLASVMHPSVLLGSQGSQNEKEVQASCLWKQFNGDDNEYLQKNTAREVAAEYYDSTREPFSTNGLIIDAKYAPMLLNLQDAEAQGPAPFSLEQSHMDTHLSYHGQDAGEVASEMSDSKVDDEDDISQYMNFDVSGTDSGICYD